MKPLHVQAIKELLQGELIYGAVNWRVHHAIYYKRQVLSRTHTLMFIHRTETIDWDEIESKKPALLVTDKPVDEIQIDLPDITIIKVPSLVQAYWSFIEYYRAQFSIPVITITGTCGKTTTKDMIRHIMSAKYNVVASVSSKNEPRRSFPYLMQMNDRTDVAVFEHGLGNSGNIKHQCLIYKPTIGILTNIGVHHLDGCHDLDGYIRAKSEIVEGISEGGILILNADDENTKKVELSPFKGEKILYISIQEETDYWATDIRYAEGGMAFTLHHDGASFEAFVPGFGTHQVYNALAAIAATTEMGLAERDAIYQLASFSNPERHMQFFEGVAGSTIIDDTWTINPTSIKAALQVIKELGREKKIIFVVGDINRLGRFEKKYHQEIGDLIAEQPIDLLITIGSKAEEIGRQAKRAGSQAEIRMLKEVEGVEKIVAPLLDQNTIVLIKGPMSSKGLIEFAKGLRKK
ncbi:UDP-N-acetylmuramoyl-tripeptide--D-alanyl-D-alanine ligase [Sporosarcina sp. NCCP-2222]|uniref:Mur ligase family protein n=1 Tax=Sporosarcina sp. NCCP-2222 TaxID=2935073 RepID=UPI002086D203|nr:UDP-N-acetylmuramoyl-tripeptide--D-alanyl-D-alanine ligase [Sporosarcina sp. NCCP-2222]GKV57541.1 UDP-N-acetylmuramoyl-tripeptide--D-alanyl-D-alanine ligase [Sporosarcina sp. NCCP-2222]